MEARSCGIEEDSGRDCCADAAAVDSDCCPSVGMVSRLRSAAFCSFSRLRCSRRKVADLMEQSTSPPPKLLGAERARGLQYKISIPCEQ